MAQLENNFSWSPSRDATFRRCEREYWWTYYGSWGGWDPGAHPEARAAYVLKNLSTRWAWVGSAVHAAIEHVLKHMARLARDGGGELGFEGAGLDPEREVEAMTRLMREQYAESRSGKYRLFPKKRFGLSEHEYEAPITDAEWKATSERAREALRSFFRTPVWETVRRSDPRTWLPIEELGQFDFDGFPVWAVLDFGMRRPDGGADIYDWKTGAPDPHGNRLQLACYVLFVHAAHGIPTEKVENHLVYLGPEPKVVDFVVSPKDLDEARHAIRESMSGMRRRLGDPEANVALRQDFPMTEDLARCASCVFRRLCGREGGPVPGPAGTPRG